MPNSMFYGILASAGGMCFIIGSMLLGSDSKNHGYDIYAPYCFFIGSLFWIGMAIGIFFDLRPKFREWNLNRKSKDLELELREKKLAIKVRELRNKQKRELETSSQSSNSLTGYNVTQEPS